MRATLWIYKLRNIYFSSSANKQARSCWLWLSQQAAHQMQHYIHCKYSICCLWWMSLSNICRFYLLESLSKQYEMQSILWVACRQSEYLKAFSLKKAALTLKLFILNFWWTRCRCSPCPESRVCLADSGSATAWHCCAEGVINVQRG